MGSESALKKSSRADGDYGDSGHGLWRLLAGYGPAQMLVSFVSLVAIIRAYDFSITKLISAPWFDYWFWVSDFQLWVSHSYKFHDLVKLHSEQHRIATARIIFLLDSLLFNMNGYFVVISNLVILFLVGFLIWMATLLDRVKLTGWGAPPLFWIALVGSVCQYSNLLLPFQVQFALVCCSGAAAALFLSTAAEAVGFKAAWRAAAAAFFCIVADFSMGSGILLTPALMLLLALRRARPLPWVIFGVPALLGLAMFFSGYSFQNGHAVPLLAPNFMVPRIQYIGEFLGSSLTAVPSIAGVAGLLALLVFLFLGYLLLIDFAFQGRPVPAGDAVLVALGVWVALCGPAGTMTVRLILAPHSALVSRYATMSLLFVAVLLGLFMRWSERANAPAALRRFGLPVMLVVLLFIMNLPTYNELADSLRRVVAVNTQLMLNNVGVEGPVAPIFLGSVDDVRRQIVFLHDQHLNVFGPGRGPPAAVLDNLRRADIAKLPACRGSIDHAYAVDRTAFLLDGWATDPAGQINASWIAVFDGQGNLLGTSDTQVTRSDVSAALGMHAMAHGFEAGFRMKTPRETGGADTPRVVHVVALFPGRPQSLCAIPLPAQIGPLMIQPLAKLVNPTPAPSVAGPDVTGLTAWSGVSAAVPRVPVAGGPGAGWKGEGVADGVLRFHLEGRPASGLALAVPFATVKDASSLHVSFTLADGGHFETVTAAPWGQPVWRAVVLPAEVLARHPGPVSVEVRSGGQSGFAIGAPIFAATQPEWSRLF
jgi:hypothetical protein